MQGLRGHKTFVHGESKNPLILSVGSSATQQRLEQVAERVALLEQQLSNRIEKLQDLVESLKAKNEQLQEQQEAVANAHVAPSAELFRHWSSCEACEPKFKTVIQPYIAGAIREAKTKLTEADFPLVPLKFISGWIKWARAQDEASEHREVKSQPVKREPAGETTEITDDNDKKHTMEAFSRGSYSRL